MASKMTANVYRQNKWRQVWKDDLFLFLLPMYKIRYFFVAISQTVETNVSGRHLNFLLGTIHLRRCQIFNVYDPYPLCRQFFTTIRKKFDQFLTSTPLQIANILNGWSLSVTTGL